MSGFEIEAYEGDQPYLFVSYCRQDWEKVSSIIEYLSRAGYRIWYDRGIAPGEEWPEVIAGHLDRSRVFLACISKNSLESHNCRKEFNFAIMKNMDFLSIILEDVTFTPVMKMQMATVQAIKYDEYETESEFLDTLARAEFLEACRKSQEEQQEEEKEREERKKQEEEKEREERKKQEEEKRQEERKKQEEEKRQEERKKQEEEKEREERKKQEEEKEREERKKQEEEKEREDQEEQQEQGGQKKFYLTRIFSDERIWVSHDGFLVGRKEELCDYAVTDNMTVSKQHAVFHIEGDICRVKDNQSKNKVYVNDEEVSQEEGRILQDGDLLELGSERFRFWVCEEEVVGK